MIKHTVRRVLSLALVFCMVFSMTCMNVYATGGTDTETTVTDTAEETAEEVSTESTEAEAAEESVSDEAEEAEETVTVEAAAEEVAEEPAEEAATEEAAADEAAADEAEEPVVAAAAVVEEAEETADDAAEADETTEDSNQVELQDEYLNPTSTVSSEDSSYEYSIVHLDNGRKYYSVESIKTIIDNAAAAGFNYIELAVGNDGLRFLLDDMSLSFTVNGTEYSYTSSEVSAAIHTCNETYYNETTDELTQDDMDEIIAYAKTKGMGVIP